MNSVETEWWTLSLPPEWWAEREGDAVLIGDRDDVGYMEITTLLRDEGAFTAAEVESIARDNSESDWQWRSASCGEFDGCTTSYGGETDALREWYLAAGPLLLFVTYSCDADNRSLDDAAVDEILDTLARCEGRSRPATDDKGEGK